MAETACSCVWRSVVIMPLFMKGNIMQFDDNTGVAKVSIGELHELVASNDLAGARDDDGNLLGVVEKYEFVPDEASSDLSETEVAELHKITAELNAVISKLHELDRRFHDIADCR